MKKLILEIVGSAALVLIPTYFVYRQLAPLPEFWNAQFAWSIALIICWIVVAAGYYHQGWLVHKTHYAEDVSIILPIAVFCVQCILFVKGIFYSDISLIIGAVLVNSGVFFSMYNIIKNKKRRVAGNVN
jgi:uncharacterized membrane protein YhdT